MLRFMIRRLALTIPVLFGLLVLTFVMVRIVPADPVAAVAGEQATREQLNALRRNYGFDRPLTEQFVVHLRQIARGDLGVSIFSNRPVAQEIFSRLPATVELTLFALLLSIVIGIPLGVLAAAHHNRLIDQFIRVFTVGGLAIASFWFAIMLQLTFSMALDLMPVHQRLSSGTAVPPLLTGLFLVDSLLAGSLDAFLDALWHITLPGATLAFAAMATITRFTRSGVLETLQTDYVTYQTAVGFPRYVLLFKYVLRNSIVTTVTQIGLLFGSMLSSAVVVEAIFDWPGLGSYAVNAIVTSDYQAIIAVVLVIGVAYAFINIAVDVIHAWMDPRTREEL